MEKIRQPIVTVLGHVDHGKTRLLDAIRNSRIVDKEAGGITQHIGATEVPADYIKKYCKPMLEKMKINITIPGLLFIDTPGHAAFSNLRKRGGSIADLAILVIDLTAGVQPQTIESIDILKQFKVPFIIAANKLDMIPYYKSENKSFLENVQKQDYRAIAELEKRIYEIVAKLLEFGFSAERFDRVSDFTKEIAIVPTSALTGEGILDLLALIAGLAQKYLKDQLKLTGITKGNILEVKKEKGLGVTVDAIIYDGSLKENDTLVLAGIEEPIVTKVRALLKPKPLAEIRAEKKFQRVKEVHAATGVKIVAPNLEDALAGGPLRVAKPEEISQVIEEIQKEISDVEFETDDLGVIIKADTLGSLEALIHLLKERNIGVRKAGIGNVTKTDIAEAEEVKQKDPFLGVILAFNVKNEVEELANSKGVKVIAGNIIYKILEEYEEYVKKEKEEIRKRQLEKLPRPAKFRIIPGYVFRASKPAIVGVEVLGGTLKSQVDVMKEDGSEVGYIKAMQIRNENVKEAGKGAQLAVSIEGPTVGRQIKEGDILYTSFTESEYAQLKKLEDLLSEDEKEVLEEIVKIKRKLKKSWGLLYLLKDD